MPSKWLTWSPKTASSRDVEPTEPTNLLLSVLSVPLRAHPKRLMGCHGCFRTVPGACLLTFTERTTKAIANARPAA